MKQLLLFFAVLFVSVAAYAQSPFMVYKPLIVPERSYSVPDLFPDYLFPDPLEEYEMRAAAEAKAREIISSEIISADGLNLYKKSYSPLKVNIIRRRNGNVELLCLGIKKNGVWSPCEKGIASLEIMYKKAESESDKKKILGLMEYGNYLLIVNPQTEIYVIK